MTNDIAAQHVDSWYAASAHALDGLPALKGEVRCDVCVIGGGLTGLSAALELAERGAFARASIKAAFNARHGGVSGLARVAHDLLLRPYLESDEAHELAEAFRAKRKPDPDKFGH